MPGPHRLLAIGVVLMWGLNFTAIDLALAQFPPTFLVALRFGLIAIPTVLLVPRPDVPLTWLIGYGLGFGTLQFIFLHAGMAAGMPAGLASLVLQASAPFTVLLGAVFLRERLGLRHLGGIALAAGGLAVVGWQRSGTTGLAPFLLVLAGAFGWAIGNIANRKAGARNALHLTLWMCVVPPAPMLALSFLTEGPGRITASLTTMTTPTGTVALIALCYSVVIATVGGSGGWTWLMARHPAGTVAPFSMMVPVVGMTTAWLLLGERVTTIELAGAATIVGGVLVATVQPHRSTPDPTQTETVPIAPTPPILIMKAREDAIDSPPVFTTTPRRGTSGHA
ncbi:EamA family transporter [Propionibacteriaceae bacterium Y2011]